MDLLGVLWIPTDAHGTSVESLWKVEDPHGTEQNSIEMCARFFKLGHRQSTFYNVLIILKNLLGSFRTRASCGTPLCYCGRTAAVAQSFKPKTTVCLAHVARGCSQQHSLETARRRRLSAWRVVSHAFFSQSRPPPRITRARSRRR